jgi:hypothetical protein
LKEMASRYVCLNFIFFIVSYHLEYVRYFLFQNIWECDNRYRRNGELWLVQ